MENNNWQLSTWHHDARDVSYLTAANDSFWCQQHLTVRRMIRENIFIFFYIYMDATSLEQGYHGYVRQEREKKRALFFFFSAATPETNSI